MNIYEKLQAITQELDVVRKNLEVGYGNSKYNAVSEGDILRAVKPLEAKHKVYSFPTSRNIVWQDTVNFTNSRGDEKTNLCMRIESIYRFVNLEKPEEFIDMTSYGDGIDTQDKGCGKAMTYADKYALMKAYKIETGDDPDAKPSDEIKRSTIQKTAPKKTEEITVDLNTARNYSFSKGADAGVAFKDYETKKLEALINNENFNAPKIKAFAKAVLESRDMAQGEAPIEIDTPPMSDEDLPF